MDSRRILLTGLSTYWGGRLAQALEAFPEVEAVIGVDNEEPSVELERTEYVKVGAQHALLRRVVEAAEIDTVVDTRLVVDSSTTSSAKAHENNIIGTMNILAACSGPGSPVRKVVFKSSTHFYGCEQDDPAFFDESMGRPHPPRTPIERDVVEAEASLNDFAERSPDVAVTVMRFANVLGPDVRTSHIELFGLQKYHPFVTMTGHFQGIVLLLCNAKCLAGWPAGVRTMLRAAAREATAAQWQLAADEEVASRSALEITPPRPR